MALTHLEKFFIYDYSQQLLQQDMLTHQVFGSSHVGEDLRNLVLKKPAQSNVLPDPFEQALSGSLRADSKATYQAGRNVGEAASMMGVAQKATAKIVDALTSMQKITKGIESGDMQATDINIINDYNALRDKILGIVSSSDYNGISLLDSKQWGTDRISSKGEVHIQSDKKAGFKIGFHALDKGTSSVNWADLQGGNLSSQLGAQKNAVEKLLSWVSSIENIYETKAADLKSQKVQIDGQAQLLDQAAKTRMPSHTDFSLEKLLAELVARHTGSVFDGKG